MIIPNCTTGKYDVAALASAAVKKTDAAKAESGAGSAAQSGAVRQPDVDTFERSSSVAEEEAVTTPKRLSADELKRVQEQQSQSFSKMLDEIISNQANAAKKASYAKNGITKDLFTDLVVTPEQKLAAQQAIGEDGEWGVNAVATRIMDMCVALSGGDSSKLDEMRAAVDKGFEQAMGQWGGSLPSICSRTHEEINRRFDYWEQNGSLDGYTYQSAKTE